MGKQYFAIQQAQREADLYIFGDIVPFEFFDGEVSAYGITQQIKDLDVDRINVHIDSYGGAVSEGWAIYNSLKNHPAKVVTYGDGFVASAALFPFMAGEERYASNLSAFYFHQVMVSASGYAEELRAAADEADMLTEIGRKAFTENTSMTEEEVRQLMESETWLTPSEALERGIATAIMADSAPRYAQGAKRQLLDRVFQKALEPPQEPKPVQEAEASEETIEQEQTPPSIMQMLGNLFSAKEE